MISLEYLGAAVDAEGTITFTRSTDLPPWQYSIAIYVTNTCLPWLQQLQARFGGKIIYHRDRNPKHKKMYQLRWYGEKARELIRDIKPYLLIKWRQAELALGYKAERNCGKRGLSPELREQRVAALAEMRQLNQRGVNANYPNP